MASTIPIYVCAPIQGEHLEISDRAVKTIKDWIISNPQLELLRWYSETFKLSVDRIERVRRDPKIARLIRDFDYSQIEKAEIIIAEVTGCSGGVAGEVERVISGNQWGIWQKPILLLFWQDAMSAITIGAIHPTVRTETYVSEHWALDIVKQFVNTIDKKT